jgi:hypothetical protein
VDYGRSSDNTDKKMSLLCNRKGLIFKLESSENGWVLRRWHICLIGFACDDRGLKFEPAVFVKTHVSSSSLYGSTTRHFLTNREHRIISRN